MGGRLYTHTQICKITDMRGKESTLHAIWVLMTRIAIMMAMNINTVDDEELPEKSSRAERYLACVTVAEPWDWGYRWIY